MDISQQEFQERKREFYDFLELSVRIHLFYSRPFLLIMQSFFFTFNEVNFPRFG